MASHVDFITDVMSDERYKEEHKMYNRNGLAIYPDKYHPDMDQLAFAILSGDDGNMTKVCVALNCTKATLMSWIRRHPTLRAAIDSGRMHGEVKFRKKVMEAAFKPSSEVNNSLIKMMAKNLYGIDDAEAANININTNPADHVTQEESSRLYADFMGRPDLEAIAETDSERDGAVDVDFEDMVSEVKQLPE